MQRQRGFTLVEILIALAIIGIIVAIAMPSYQQSVRRSNRTDAHLTMARLALMQERYFFQNNEYAGDMATLVGAAALDGDGNFISDDGHYVITTAVTGNTWTLTAAPAADSDQVNDAECQVLNQTGLGQKTAQDIDSQANPSCWE